MERSSRYLGLAVVALMLFLFSPPGAGAVDLPPEKEAVAREIFVSTMSPFCVARSLQDCPSGAAHDLKEKIREKLAAGMSKQAVIEDLFATYGDKVRSVPDTRGFGLIGWVAPLGFLILGGVVLLVWIRSRAEPAHSPQSGESPGLDPEVQKRIDEELSKF